MRSKIFSCFVFVNRKYLYSLLYMHFIYIYVVCLHFSMSLRLKRHWLDKWQHQQTEYKQRHYTKTIYS